MAGWSILSDGSSLDCMEILHTLQNTGFCLDLNPSFRVSPEAGKDKLRCLFDRILSVFLKEISQNKEIRPLPVMLGDGQCVDVFKLYRVVKERGGYDLVTRNGSWAEVAEESGFGSDVGPSIKLIYVKYLSSFDRWLRQILKENRILANLSDHGERLGAFSVELENEIKEILFEVSDWNKKVEEPAELDLESDKFRTPARGNGHVIDCVMEPAANECADEDGDEVLILDEAVAGGEFSSLKRKRDRERQRERESLLGMLNWLLRVAKSPGDPANRKMLEASTRKVHGVEEHLTRALIAKKALLVKRNACLSLTPGGSLLQKRQKMHPSMYEDYVGSSHQATEKLRFSERLLSQHRRSRSGSCSETSSVPDSDLDKCLDLNIPGRENDPGKRVLGAVGCLSSETAGGLFLEDQFQKRVPVGPLFQAELPAWTGVTSEHLSHDSIDSDDSKWLGTRQWPPKEREFEMMMEDDAIGKGRPNSCGCKFPGSVNCVTLHVTEKRVLLNRELRSTFINWRFNHMGEQVSLQWTEEEEQMFKVLVHQNPPSLGKSFWDQVHIRFPSKSRQELVSYYFNVFVLRRRSFQNRVTPHNIDSDDDESEVGFVSNSFIHDAVKVSGSRFILCAQNKQCIDLDQQM